MSTGEILALMKELGKGKLLGQTHYTNINSDLHSIIPLQESQPSCTSQSCIPIAAQTRLCFPWEQPGSWPAEVAARTSPLSVQCTALLRALHIRNETLSHYPPAPKLLFSKHPTSFQGLSRGRSEACWRPWQRQPAWGCVFLPLRLLTLRTDFANACPGQRQHLPGAVADRHWNETSRSTVVWVPRTFPVLGQWLTCSFVFIHVSVQSL